MGTEGNEGATDLNLQWMHHDLHQHLLVGQKAVQVKALALHRLLKKRLKSVDKIEITHFILLQGYYFDPNVDKVFASGRQGSRWISV